MADATAAVRGHHDQVGPDLARHANDPLMDADVKNGFGLTGEAKRFGQADDIAQDCFGMTEGFRLDVFGVV